MREWSDRRAYHLYTLATSPGDGKIRREAVLFLGALERAGSGDAAWAMDSLRRQGKAKDRRSLNRGSPGETGPAQ